MFDDEGMVDVIETEAAVRNMIFPVFEVIEDAGRHFKIFSDGRIEGFEKAIVINRIPALFACLIDKPEKQGVLEGITE